MRRSRRKRSTLLSALILEIATLLAIVTVAQPTAVMHFFENMLHRQTAVAPSTTNSVPPVEHIASSNAPQFLDQAVTWPPLSVHVGPVLPPQANLQFVPNYR